LSGHPARVPDFFRPVHPSLGGGRASTTTEITMDFLRFGPVSKIELPKPDEIYDATSRVESELKSAAEAPEHDDTRR
ncbi:MAG TPA: hypothetical protein VFN82_00410, partial [Solirubrobacterales bacterium]|nr:hypothetical protein [Solirubrobacterales bacterium]